MKKIIYAITKIGKTENQKITGQGYLTDADIVTAQMSKKNTPYVRVYEDIVKNCFPVTGKTNEYKGAFSELINYDGQDIEIDYFVWYKIVD